MYISRCDFFGDVAPAARDANASFYKSRLLHSEILLIGLGQTTDDCHIDIQIGDEQKITLAFRNAANDIVKQVSLSSPAFYDAAKRYRDIVADYNNLMADGRESVAASLGVHRRHIHNEGASLLQSLLKDDGVVLGHEETRSLFYLCSHALRSTAPSPA